MKKEELLAILKEAEKQINRIKDIIPKDVINPVKWIKKNRPDLASDKKLMASLQLAYDLLKPKLKKAMRKKTRVRYTLKLAKDEARAFRRVIEYYCEEYYWGSLDPEEPSDILDFTGRLLKGIYNSYMLYISGEHELHLSQRELTAISVAINQFLSDILEEPESAKIEKDVIVTLDNWLKEGKIIKSLVTTIPYEDEEGKWRVQTKERVVETKISEIAKKK